MPTKRIPEELATKDQFSLLDLIKSNHGTPDLGKCVPLSVSCPILLERWIREYAKAIGKSHSVLCVEWLKEGFDRATGKHVTYQLYVNENAKT